jgi:hypothetical protein
VAAVQGLSTAQDTRIPDSRFKAPYTLLISVLEFFFDKYSSYNSTYNHKFPSFIKFDHQLIHSVTHMEPSALSKDRPGKFRKTKQGETQY